MSELPEYGSGPDTSARKAGTRRNTDIRQAWCLQNIDSRQEKASGKSESLQADPVQTAAIRNEQGPCAVIAGPGSGKTFVLVHRIRHLIKDLNVPPERILVLTFSRAAAQQMRSRFLQLEAGEDASMKAEGAAEDCAGVVFGTIHAVFYRILQESSREKLRMIDAASRYRYLRHLCEVRGDLEKASPEELQFLISSSKNGLPCDVPWLASLVEEYDRYLESRGFLDFDDMILRCRSMLLQRPDILRQWRERFSWILVDEFQDVSRTQYEVLALLAAPQNNLFVVGDDDQSIYGFRGADPGTMQRFLSEYKPDLQCLWLTTNYRCGKSILHAGSLLIRDNKNRLSKDFRSGCSAKGSFTCRPFTSRAQQYEYLAGELLLLEPSSRPEAAVIFRTHAGERAFLSVLETKNIPFSADSDPRRPAAVPREVQILEDLAAYYRAAARIHSRGASRRDLLRIMNRPERFLSGSFAPFEKMDAQSLTEHAGFEKETVRELLNDLDLLDTLAPVYSLRYLLDSIGYRTYAEQESQREETRIRDLFAHLLQEAAGYKHASGWLAYLENLQAHFSSGNKNAGRNSFRSDTMSDLRSVGKSGDNSCDQAGKKNSQESRNLDPQIHCVRVLTMHACKGLEFDHVWIPDLNEGNIPSRRAWTQDQIEEERRLLYVAMTRARLSLTMTYLEGTPDRPAAPSRFLRPFLKHLNG